MSVPSPYMQRHASTDPKEDCRDYLRTGRCKYGASCKYNHPPNVQSGGGIKPLDPSEPMFPVRPNEPFCQYYMKHGTCKFGQTCKFHHPPASVATSRDGCIVLPGNAGPKNHGSQVLWNSGSEAGVPMLPQRPDEPNCIYFLKNGRCKYGATCRYHHPLNYHERKAALDDGRRHHLQVNQGHGDNVVHPKLHYVSLPPGTYQQGHFVVADGQLAFLSLDGSSPGQVISVAPQQSGGKDGPMVFTTTSNAGTASRPLSRDVVSSTSSTSIASSYETASGGSLNTFNMVEQSPHGRSHMVHSGRGVVIQNANESVNSLPRVVSTGNASDGSTVYYDANSGMNRQGHSGPGGSGGVAWRGQRSSSFDHSRQSLPSRQGQEGLHESSSVPSFPISYEDQGPPPPTLHPGYQRDPQRSPMMRGRPPQGPRTRRSRQNGVEVDDGLSMMTSALLTMLDTPEERAAEYYQDYDDPRGPSSQSSTPLMGNQYPSRREAQNARMPNSYNMHTPQYMPQPGSYYDQNAIEDKSIGMPVHQSDAGHLYEREEAYPNNDHDSPNERVQRWSPTWQAAAHIGGPLQQPSQSMSVVQPQPSHNSSHDNSNVGLYLP